MKKTNKLTTEEEKQLLENCMESGRKDLIVRQYFHLIKYIIPKILQKKGIIYSYDDVHDLCNDVFIRIFENDCKRLKQYRPKKGRTLANWIIMITTQTVMGSTDKQNPHNIATREKLVPIREEFMESLGFEEPEEKLKSREILRKIQDSLIKLSPPQGMVIRLHYFDEPPKSLEAIAKLTNRSIQAVYNIKHRAIKRLKELLKIDESK